MLPELPLTYDLISHIMFAGIVQSLFLGITLLYKSIKGGQLLLLWGLLVVCMCLISFDLYLCYTGLMQYSLMLNDSTEFIALLIAPLSYLITSRMLSKDDIKWSQTWPHLIGPGLYFLNMFFFWRQPIVAKYNAYVDAYFPEIEQLSYTYITKQDPLHIKEHIDWWILVSFIVYFGLTLRFITRHTHLKDILKGATRYGKYDLIIKSLGTTMVFLVIFVLVESLNDRDAGDYVIGLMITVIAFSFSYFVISNSKMIDPNWIAEKYSTSGISEAEARQLYKRVSEFLNSHQFSNNPSINQDGMAAILGSPKAYLSRAIKYSAYDNFNDLLNHHRVQLAKTTLGNTDHQHLTIEAIGNMAGFGSRSAFYAAFKKEVGKTPAAYMKDL